MKFSKAAILILNPRQVRMVAIYSPSKPRIGSIAFLNTHMCAIFYFRGYSFYLISLIGFYFYILQSPSPASSQNFSSLAILSTFLVTGHWSRITNCSLQVCIYVSITLGNSDFNPFIIKFISDSQLAK